MKRPIAWHEQRLESRLVFLRQLEKEQAQIQAEVERSRAELDVLKAQIARAKREGKAAFDDERFNIPRK